MKIKAVVYISRRWPFSFFQKIGWLKERRLVIEIIDDAVMVTTNCSKITMKRPPMIKIEQRQYPFMEVITPPNNKPDANHLPTPGIL